MNYIREDTWTLFHRQVALVGLWDDVETVLLRSHSWPWEHYKCLSCCHLYYLLAQIGHNPEIYNMERMCVMVHLVAQNSVLRVILFVCVNIKRKLIHYKKLLTFFFLNRNLVLSNACSISRSPAVKFLNNTQEKLSLVNLNCIIFTSMES